MEKLLSGKSCEHFTAELASPAPVPGGGGVTALLGALSAALCAMAANLSRPRAKDPAVGEALADAAERAQVLRRHLISLIDADAEAFLPLSRAYGLPMAFDKVYGVTADNVAVLGSGNIIYLLNLS